MTLKETNVLSEYAVWQPALEKEVVERKAYFARCENCDMPGCTMCFGCGGGDGGGDGGDGNGNGGNEYFR